MGLSSAKASFSLWYEPELKAVGVEWNGPLRGEEFRRSYEELLSLLVQYGTGRILGDITRMSPSYTEDQQWFKYHWLPRAIEAGYRTCAFVGPGDLVSSLIVEQLTKFLAGKGVTIRFFPSLDEAKAWLRSQL
jgi:hypothetical protein